MTTKSACEPSYFGSAALNVMCKMNFIGTINQVTKTSQGVEIRLSKNFYLDENIFEPIKIIRAAKCEELSQTILNSAGEEIDGYDVDSNGITLWVNWYNDGKPIKIKASEITEEDRPYEIDDYSQALASAHESYQQQAKEVYQLRLKIKKITSVLDHELDNLKRRIEFDSKKAERYLKAVEILSRLRKLADKT